MSDAVDTTSSVLVSKEDHVMYIHGDDTDNGNQYLRGHSRVRLKVAEALIGHRRLVVSLLTSRNDGEAKHKEIVPTVRVF